MAKSTENAGASKPAAAVKSKSGIVVAGLSDVSVRFSMLQSGTG